MAQRRMFSRSVINADQFIDMSAEARVLYFHLGMEADDDGFVGNPRSILRVAGCCPSDLKELETQGYVLMFSSGVCAILHWREHNLLRRDRYTPTVYREEFAALYPGEEPGADTTTDTATDTATNTATNMATNMAPQVRIGKEKEREEKKGQVSPGKENTKKRSAGEVSEGECEGERALLRPWGQIVENFPLTPEEQCRRLQSLMDERRAERQQAYG